MPSLSEPPDSGTGDRDVGGPAYPPGGQAALPSGGSRYRDPWLLAASAATTAIYLALLFIQPSGDEWGRGWNLVAFWFYASPAAVLAGLLAFWRSRKAVGARRIPYMVGALGLAFPLVCALILPLKN